MCGKYDVIQVIQLVPDCGQTYDFPAIFHPKVRSEAAEVGMEGAERTFTSWEKECGFYLEDNGWRWRLVCFGKSLRFLVDKALWWWRKPGVDSLVGRWLQPSRAEAMSWWPCSPVLGRTKWCGGQSGAVSLGGLMGFGAGCGGWGKGGLSGLIPSLSFHRIGRRSAKTLTLAFIGWRLPTFSLSLFHILPSTVPSSSALLLRPSGTRILLLDFCLTLPVSAFCFILFSVMTTLLGFIISLSYIRCWCKLYTLRTWYPFLLLPPP